MLRHIVCVLFALMLFAAPALGETRALLAACSDFVTQPDLGAAISGNLHRGRAAHRT